MSAVSATTLPRVLDGEDHPLDLNEVIGGYISGLLDVDIKH